MIKIFAIASLLALGACQTSGNVVIQTKLRVVEPTENMYRCPQINKLPNPDTLTDHQVAKTLRDLYGNNKICKNSLDTVKRFIEDSKRQIETN